MSTVDNNDLLVLESWLRFSSPRLTAAIKHPVFLLSPPPHPSLSGWYSPWKKKKFIRARAFATLNHFSRYNTGVDLWLARSSLPPPPRKSEREENFVRDCENNSGRKRIGEKEKKGEERRGGETYAVASRPGYCIVFSFGTNDLPCFPLYCRELLQPRKNT